MDSEELTSTLLSLVERSEARIDKTNEMISTLAATCRQNTEMYNQHLSSLENSRDIAQKNAATAIECSKELTELLSLLREDFIKRNKAITQELHILRDEYKKDLDEMRRDYRKLSDSYTRLAEGGAKGVANKTDIKINQ